MKIGLITFEFNYNYGAILQATALSDYLTSLGHTVKIINRGWGPLPKPAEAPPAISKLPGRLIEDYWSYYSLNRFKKSHWKLTENIAAEADYPKVYDEFDAIITGSDQIWNSACIDAMGLHYFGINADPEKQTLIAYAPSFGKNLFEADDENMARLKLQLQNFKAISVREADGVELLQNHFGIGNAIRVLDPTMLMNKEYYYRLAKINQPKTTDTLAYYILDPSPEKMDYINRMAKLTGLKPVNIGKEASKGGDSIIARVKNLRYPSVESWLRKIAQSRMVITDSFHGTVFSIIMNKDFLTFGNASRGNSRFDNLLSMFGLEGRLTSVDKAECNEHPHIDYSEVNRKMADYQTLSKRFLENALSH